MAKESLNTNLQQVKNDIKEWKENTVDLVMNQKRKIMARLNGVQRGLQRNENYAGLKRLEKNLQHELHKILHKEELMWFQRSRGKWLADGDRNTRYYHRKIINRRRKNRIRMIKDNDGQWIEDSAKIQDMFNNYYKELFARKNGWMKWEETEVTLPKLEDNVLQHLKEEVRDDEIKNAVFVMKPWKASGPDGYPAGFYQKSWNIVGEQVCDFVKGLWKKPVNIAAVNQTNICLIPKIDNATSMSQFRPISLCNTSYKILSKVLVDRLKECIPKLVSPYQTGFVPGRAIHENIIVAKEMMHLMNKKKGRKGYFAIKVDLEKAYDKIS